MYLLARHRMASCFFFLILNESINISIYHFSWLSLTRRDFRILPVEQRWIFRETLGQWGPISFPQMLFWLRKQVLDSAAMRKDTRSSRIRFKIHTLWVSPVLLKNSIAYHFNLGIAVMPEIKVHNSLWRKLINHSLTTTGIQMIWASLIIYSFIQQILIDNRVILDFANLMVNKQIRLFLLSICYGMLLSF